MSYYNKGRNVIEATKNTTVAIAAHESGAEIIVKVLNCYFKDKMFTGNQSVEMMHKNNAASFLRVAEFCEKHEYTAKTIIQYLRDLAEEMEAQALVVSMRDELKFDKPNE